MSKRWVFLVCVLGLLCACRLPFGSGKEASSATLATASAVASTASAALTGTASVPISASPVTATPEVTFSPTPWPSLTALVASALPAGQRAVEHPGLPGVIFQVDETAWEIVFDSARPDAFLVHRSLPGCRLELVPPMGPPMPLSAYPQVIAGRRWFVTEYQKEAYYWGLDRVLDLLGFRDAQCLAAQRAVLAGIRSGAEWAGGPTATPFATITPRPALSGFDCSGAPLPRLRSGDRALIVTDALILRSEPRVAAETRIRSFPRFAPYEIAITGGPVCAETAIFWPVRLAPYAEGGDSLTGWMMEGLGKEYYLAPYDQFAN